VKFNIKGPMRHFDLAVVRRVFEFAVVAAVFCTANPDDMSLLLGLSISGIGELIRIWAAGYPLRTAHFHIAGPYRFVRHPRYLGTFFTLLGLCFAGQNPYVVGVYVLGISVIYHFSFKQEELALITLAGPRFEKYRSQVGAFIPQLIPAESSNDQKFSLAFAVFKRQRREFESILGLILGFGLMYVSMLIPSRTISQSLLFGVVVFILAYRVLVMSRRRFFIS
jgi:protein-S-isoprenylcysteine O-methyltransferase Ste14